MMYGCPSCHHIYDLSVLYAKESLGQCCPNCGDPSQELGEAPAVTEKEGLYYLVGDQNCMGPYSDPLQAQLDLPKWFGIGVNHAEKEEPRINKRYEVIEGGKAPVPPIPCFQPGAGLGRTDEQEPDLSGQGSDQDGK